jgi:predicted RNase H-like HicB family nuclease
MRLAALLDTRHDSLSMQFNIETEMDSDGRWIAEVIEVPGALAYGLTREEAFQRALALASLQ